MAELMPWHKNWLVNIDYDRVDLVKEGANSQAHIKLFKSKGDTTMTIEEILKSLKPEHATIVEDVLKQKDKAIADAEEALKVAKSAEPAAPAAGQSEEEILKSVKDPAVKALLETQIAKAKAAESVAKALKDKEETAEAIAKAKEVPNLGAEEQILADVYKKLKGVDQELCDNVFGIFKAASALVAEGGALSEVGKSAGTNEGGAASDEASAWAAIEKAADPIAKAKGIKKEAAISEVIRTNPELYNAYLKAQIG